MNDKNFIEELRQKREEYGVTQTRLAVACGISREYYNRIEKGKQPLNDELREVILDSTCHFFQFSTLFQTGIDIECQNWKNSTIHSHGHRHLVQRNTIEKNLHILQ